MVGAGRVRGKTLHPRARPDVIYSTGGPLASHRAAAAIAGRYGITWIAEIRDPLPYNIPLRGGLHRRLVPWLEHLIHNRVAGVVYVTRTACERAKMRTAGRAPCTAIYPGGEPLEADACSASTHMRLVHAGSLGGTRNPGVLLQALAEAVTERPSLRDGLRLTLLGEMEEAGRRQVAAFAYPEMVQVIEKRPRVEAQAMVAEADVLLVLQNLEPVSEETIPSKVYDYLVSGKPVLALLFGNTELAAMLSEAGHEAVAATDAGAVAQSLLHLHDLWAAGRLTSRPDLRHTRAGATAELVAWARSLREKDSTSGEAAGMGRAFTRTCEKIVDLETARARVAEWRVAGEAVAYTNGCFDLLHAGHVGTLETARQFGDRLLVAMNSDASARRLKGPTRPIVPQQARAKMLAALEAVDLVVIFEEDTPIAVLEAIKPEVWVKGGDYRGDTVNQDEKAYVESYGGKVQLAGHVEGFSTSELIARIRDLV